MHTFGKPESKTTLISETLKFCLWPFVLIFRTLDSKLSIALKIKLHIMSVFLHYAKLSLTSYKANKDFLSEPTLHLITSELDANSSAE